MSLRKFSKPTNVKVIHYEDVLDFDSPLIANRIESKHIKIVDDKSQKQTVIIPEKVTPMNEINQEISQEIINQEIKKKVVKKKQKENISTELPEPAMKATRKVSTYNVFVKEKREEFTRQYPNLSKTEIFSMVLDEYRKFKNPS